VARIRALGISNRIEGVRGPQKTAAAAAAALMLAAVVAGCGGSGGSGSTASTTQAPTQAGQGQAQRGQAQAKRVHGGEPSRRQPSSGHSGGGGVAEFRVPGGDNSIQEFGAEAGRSELAEAGAALHGFLDARVAGEWSKVCAFLARDAAEGLERLSARSKHGHESCGAIMKALSGGVPKSSLEEAAQADVGALRIEGDRAFLLYHGARNTDYAISMTTEGGAWKVEALAGVPLS
jgi:hypothetical protein